MLQDKASRDPSGPTTTDQAGQQLHVSGVFIVILELALVIENTLPILVVVQWLPSCARGVGDRLIAAFSVTCILSALIPTPLGLASYFSGSWYGGSPTCTTYQVTSIWCNLSSLALLAYVSINCRFAVRRLVNLQLSLPLPSTTIFSRNALRNTTPPVDVTSLPSTNVNESSQCAHVVNSLQMLTSAPSSPTGRLELNSLQNEIHDFQGEDVNDARVRSPLKVNGFYHGVNRSSEHNHNMQSTPDRSNINPIPQTEIRTTSQYDHANCLISKTDQNHCERDQSQCDFTGSTENHENHDMNHSNAQPAVQLDSGLSLEEHDGCASQPTDCSNNIMYDSKYMLRNPLIYEDSTFIYTQSLDTTTQPDTSSKVRTFRPRDYVSLVLFFLYSITLAIASLPVVGFGPQHRTNDRMCNSWLVPTPTNTKEKTFFILFLVFVYLCLLFGCASGAQVCFLVNKRLKQESKRTSRLYHQEDNVPDIREFSILDDLKRHYSLACIVMSGILTWVPIVVMLTLQKSGVKISEATLVYSNIATSLPGLLNPLLYSLVLTRYRDGYKAVFDRCCRKKARYRQHPMKSVGNHRDSDDMCEITITSSTDGHQAMHGRPNPNLTQSRHLAADDLSDDDIDEDCFYDEQDDHFHQRMEQLLSEKTPLHASVAVSSSNQNNSADVRNVHVTARHWPHLLDQSNHFDKEYLLAREISNQDDETGL